MNKYILRGLIIGGVWGLVSVLFIVMGVSEKNNLSLFYYLISTPAWILIVIKNKVFGMGGEMIFIFTPIVYIFVGAGIGYLYSKFKNNN